MKKKFPYRYRVLALLFFLIVVTYLDRICIGLVGERIKHAFNLTNIQFGWVASAFVLAYALFEIRSGTLGDRIGQRALLIRIVLCWSVFTALTGLTTGLLSLVIVRFCFGLGEAGAFPNSCGVISRWFPVNETSRGVSALMLGVYAGSAIAPLIVIPITVAFNWRMAFFVNGFIGLIWILICFLWFRNNPSEKKGISDEEKHLIEKNRRVIGHKQDFPWKTALKSRSMRALCVSYFCSQAGFYFFIAWFLIYLQEGRHFTENTSKTIISFFYIVGTGGALIAGILNDWFVKRKGLIFGRRLPGMLPLSIFGICFLIAGITPNNAVAVASLYLGILFFPSSPTASFSTCVDIGSDRSGTVAGIMNFSGQMGAFFSSLFVGIIIDLTHSYNIPMLLIGGLLLVGSLFWLLVDPTKKIITENRPVMNAGMEIGLIS